MIDWKVYQEATPKGLMRIMGIAGLTLYHLKSHLQKYRLGKNPQSETCSDSKQESADQYKDDVNELSLFSEGDDVNDPTQEQIKENVRVAHALQIQMEVQRKLHEQIEVQRHLQLRIEAQGKYLQKVLRKAQDTLSSYNFSSAGVEHAKAELSQLVSMVSTSSFSELTETADLPLENLHQKHRMRAAGCSVESSLTSSESSGRRDEERETSDPFTLPLLDPASETRGSGTRKRSRSMTCDGNEVEHKGLRKLELLKTFDLNRKCENDLDLGPKQQQALDLNFKGV